MPADTSALLSGQIRSNWRHCGGLGALQALEASARKGCRLCGLIYDAFEDCRPRKSRIGLDDFIGISLHHPQKHMISVGSESLMATDLLFELDSHAQPGLSALALAEGKLKTENPETVLSDRPSKFVL